MNDIETSGDYGWENPHRCPSHSYIEPAIVRLLQSCGAKKVLDLGCGNGALCRTLKDAGFNVAGCDADEQGVAIAAKANPDISFLHIGVCESAEKLGNSEFDAVVSTEVIEHLFSPQCLPRFAHAVLKKNGCLILSTPYHGSLKNLVLSVLNKWDVHHTPLWEGGPIKFWSRRTLTTLLEQQGFRVEGFEGVGRLPLLWKSMVLIARKVEDAPIPAAVAQQSDMDG